MSDLNVVSLVGRLTNDADVRESENGKSCLTFSLANNRFYKQNQEKKEDVSYFKIIVWGKLGESLRPYLNKGKQVAVQGRLHQYKYKNTEEKLVSFTEIVADRIQLISSPKKDEQPDRVKEDLLAVENDVPF